MEAQKDPYTAVAYLYAYDGNNLIWTTEYPSVPAWTAGMTFQTISDDGYLIVGGFAIAGDTLTPLPYGDGVVQAYVAKIDPESGETQWETYLSSVNNLPQPTAMVFSGGKIYVQVAHSWNNQSPHIEILNSLTGANEGFIYLQSQGPDSGLVSQLKLLNDGSMISAIINQQPQFNIQKINADGTLNGDLFTSSAENVT